MKGFGIYVKNDLLEPKHFKAIGQALWLYLWLLDKMTSISEDGIGKVLHGVPVKFSKINQDLPMSPSSYTRYIEALEQAGYITALRTPYGHVFAITKAKKIFGNRENHKKAESQIKRITIVTAENHNCDGNKEDNTINKTIKSEASASAENMIWNKQSEDYEEGVIDLDGDGTLLSEKKKSTRKYPNAPAVRKVFQEALGKNPSNWRINATQLQACENLFTERTIEKVRSALEFYVESKEKEYCPQISSPFDLDAKWTKLGEFKLKQS